MWAKPARLAGSPPQGGRWILGHLVRPGARHEWAASAISAVAGDGARCHLRSRFFFFLRGEAGAASRFVSRNVLAHRVR